MIFRVYLSPSKLIFYEAQSLFVIDNKTNTFFFCLGVYVLNAGPAYINKVLDLFC